MSRPRVVVAGLGDSGLLTAIHLARTPRTIEVVGISAKPALVSGQELGTRLTRPDEWARDYRVPFEHYRRLRDVRTVHGRLSGLDLAGRTVSVEHADGRVQDEQYDVLVVSTGVTNGFWRRPHVESAADVDAALRAPHEQLAAADSVIVVGGGAAAVSSALNIALRWPGTRVDLYFPGQRAVPQHHPRAWTTVRQRLVAAGVGLHPGHRAVVPDGFACDRITSGEVAFSTGQPPVSADAVLWTIGHVRPNSDWLPPDVLDEDGFVRVRPTLQVPGHDDVFAVGDIAATDPLRSSARNRADKLLARNIRAHLAGRPLHDYRPPRSRWGSIMGVQHDGLVVFAPTGHGFRFPAWSIDTVLQPWIVRRGIYKGVRTGTTS